MVRIRTLVLCFAAISTLVTDFMITGVANVAFSKRFAAAWTGRCLCKQKLRIFISPLAVVGALQIRIAR